MNLSAHLQALGCLLAGALMLLLGTPGVDFLGRSDLRTPKDRAALRKEVGEPAATIGITMADLNRSLRLPLYDKVAWVQKPFRLSQNWSLYRDGPHRVRRLEIWVDGDLKHRSADPDYTWLNAQLRNRRVRPMVESTTMKKGSPNWRGLSRYIGERAQEDFPGCQRVELRAMEGPFPGEKMTQHHQIVLTAPSWTAEES